MAHTYILGASGSGKSTHIKSQIVKDIKAGNAVVFIDPHGEDIDDLLQYIPSKYVKKTVLLDLSDRSHIFSWNVLSETDDPYLSANMLAGAIKDSAGYGGTATPVMSMYLRFLFATLIENKRTFSDVFSVFNKRDTVQGNSVLNKFWSQYDCLSDRDKRQEISSTNNKLYTLLFDPHFQHFFSTSNGKFKLRNCLNDKILFVKLPQGQLSIETVSLMGSFILSLIHLVSLNRDVSKPLSIYIDEVHSFSSSTIAEMLSGLRKFNVHITVAHQFIDQLDKKLFTSLMGNCQHKCIFKVSREDADRLTDRLTSQATHDNLDELRSFNYRLLPYDRYRRDREVEKLNNPNPHTLQKIKDNTYLKYCREH